MTWTLLLQTINTFRNKFTYVFSCGGIGPTHDDITTESVAKAFNQKLEKNTEAMRRLTLHYENTNIEFNESRQKMAIIPTNSKLIDNPVSAAPGYKIENLFVFAGVPKIMQGMFHTILNELTGGKKLFSKTVYFMFNIWVHLTKSYIIIFRNKNWFLSIF